MYSMVGLVQALGIPRGDKGCIKLSNNLEHQIKTGKGILSIQNPSNTLHIHCKSQISDHGFMNGSRRQKCSAWRRWSDFWLPWGSGAAGKVQFIRNENTAMATAWPPEFSLEVLKGQDIKLVFEVFFFPLGCYYGESLLNVSQESQRWLKLFSVLNSKFEQVSLKDKWIEAQLKPWYCSLLFKKDARKWRFSRVVSPFVGTKAISWENNYVLSPYHYTYLRLWPWGMFYVILPSFFLETTKGRGGWRPFHQSRHAKME